jgi:hypothetical protein
VPDFVLKGRFADSVKLDLLALEQEMGFARGRSRAWWQRLMRRWGFSLRGRAPVGFISGTRWLFCPFRQTSLLSSITLAGTNWLCQRPGHKNLATTG